MTAWIDGPLCQQSHVPWQLWYNSLPGEPERSPGTLRER